MTETSRSPEIKPDGQAQPHAGNYHWTGAVVLVALGVIFLLKEAGVVTLGDNWWVVFLLLPAAFLFISAWQRYQAAGQLAGNVWSQVLGGVILVVLALTFLFEWNWGMIWPVFLIVAGLYMLIRRRA